ncbi:Flagellar hook-associated protein 3 [Tepidanaerobacter acetatoxydans Re1]|uniref:Flagellar hook-associated protein 3 n=1 Tax=Tepidanaerobacter acetatoxydans (strain DSM 21804 / JCM 16047 / Re1) TaxID=1209989 RepID=F4LX29_TEPAE|nr:flagellar hook-associated protein FlgL [Tepidanaerobacter acetatoxydans]AEE91007.1 flagellar hook-associated protein 3 [Tepidanaerobacter acetatoxydans Re1]CCP25614.1 Flagellar hook-associated protein 3 [Tepidanaerobacter acetatoxydans Re1]
MRVTQSMISENFTRNLMQNLKRLSDVTDKILSEKNIRRPSDDPVGVAMAIKLRRQIAAIQQYNSNAQDALTWMKDTETALTNTGDVLQRLDELTVQVANGTLTPDDREKILYEVKELKDQLFQEANSTSLDRYLFGGYSTNKPPFIKNDITGEIEKNPDTFNGAIEYDLGQSERISINLTGYDVFSDIFKAVENLETAIEADDTEALSGQVLADIKNATSTVLKYRAQIGARSNRLEATVLRLDANEVDYKAQLSNIEDIDLAQMITDLKMEESVYRASLSVGARIIQPSLVDFLR